MSSCRLTWQFTKQRQPKTLLVTDELCRLLRISREDLIANLDKSMFGFVHPDDIGRMAYFGKNFAAHTDEKYDVFFRWKTPKMEDYHIFHSWANHVLVDGVSLGFFFYSDMEESGKNNHILDTHYQKYANDQMYQDRLSNLPNLFLLLWLQKHPQAAELEIRI